LRRKLVRRLACHGSILSGVGASGKPGAVQLQGTGFSGAIITAHQARPDSRRAHRARARDRRNLSPLFRRPGGIEVLAYDYVEAFAEKFRALAERTRPRDPYDVVNLSEHRRTPRAATLRRRAAHSRASNCRSLPRVVGLARWISQRWRPVQRSLV